MGITIIPPVYFFRTDGDGYVLSDVISLSEKHRVGMMISTTKHILLYVICEDCYFFYSRTSCLSLVVGIPRKSLDCFDIPPADGTISLSGSIPDLSNGYGVLAFYEEGIQNGSPDGLALVDSSDEIIQFLSYEGE